MRDYDYIAKDKSYARALEKYDKIVNGGDVNMKIRGFELVKDEFRKHPEVNIQLPKRGSKKSAGYDIYTPVDIVRSEERR